MRNFKRAKKKVKGNGWQKARKFCWRTYFDIGVEDLEKKIKSDKNRSQDLIQEDLKFFNDQ